MGKGMRGMHFFVSHLDFIKNFKTLNFIDKNLNFEYYFY